MTETETIEFNVPDTDTVDEMVDLSGYKNVEMFIMDELDRAVDGYENIQNIEADETIEITLPKNTVDNVDRLLNDEGYVDTKGLIEYLFKMAEYISRGGGGGISKKKKPKP